ncbi:MAG: hypothetical protein DRJ61_11220, partial [Acidobacteria bacterium]
RGYGLTTLEPDGTLRLRSSYRALKTLADLLDGAISLGPLPSPEGAWAFTFQRGDTERIVAWSLTPGVRIDLPGTPRAVVDRDGRALETPKSSAVVLGPSPQYFEM